MLLIFLTVAVFTAQAFDLRDALAGIPGMEKCTPNPQMFDASGKLPDGISSGNMLALGNFDQCLQIENKTRAIKGQYCMVKLVFPNIEELVPKQSDLLFEYNLTDSFKNKPKIENRIIMQGIDGDNAFGPLLGWCLPDTCPISELTKVLSTILAGVHPDLKVKPLMGGMCQTKDDLVNKYDTNNIILIAFLGTTLFLMLISTLYDMYLKYNKKKPVHVILIAFSVRTNGEKLLTTSKNADQLGCLNGIRFISMMWVVLGHRFVSSMLSPNINLMETLAWMNKPENMYMLNAPVAVDSFFVLSGLLIAYTFCLAMEKGVKFNIIMFYVHRYLRLTPVLAVVVWVHATILDFFGSGPFWPYAKTFKTSCIDYWWAPLVYAQNYYNNENMCIGQTWYLAVDMQLYILSPIILIPLWKWPKWTLIASSILVLGSNAISFAVSYVKELPGFSLQSSENPDYMTGYYYVTHTRYGPWLMGLMLGYYIFRLRKNKNNRISLHPVQVAFGWIVGMGLLLSTLYAGYNLLSEPDRLGNAFFNAFHRHGWALGLCWVIYACTQGYGGPINTFLSWSLFQILGRFTYTMYLVHLTLQVLIACSSKTVTHFSEFQTMYTFWGDLMMTLAISVCLTLAYESPMMTIEKVLFKTGHKTKKPELSTHNPTNSQNAHTNRGFEGD